LPADALRLADVGSELAAAFLALLLLRLAAAGQARTIAPALVVAALAACDAFRPHAALAYALAAMVPFESLAGVPLRRLAKLVVLSQIFGTAATLVLLATPPGVRRPLARWLATVAFASVVGEMLPWLLAGSGRALGIVEELIEIAASLAAAARLTLGQPAPARRPDRQVAGLRP